MTVSLNLRRRRTYSLLVTPLDVDRPAPGAPTTRDRLLGAAQACFLADGYVRTTTRTIADRAGLTERTLFNLFPTKADLFREAVATAVSGLSDGARVRDMVEVQDLSAARDLTGAVRSLAGTVARLHRRSAPYAAVALQAAAVDESAAELWRWGKREQEKDIRAILSALLEAGRLPEERAQQAVDGLLVLTSHETYAQLCVERAWSEDRYVEWLVAHLALELR